MKNMPVIISPEWRFYDWMPAKQHHNDQQLLYVHLYFHQDVKPYI
jgi:hypothetical protein